MSAITVEDGKYKKNGKEAWHVKKDGSKKFTVLISYDTLLNPYFDGTDGNADMTDMEYGDFYVSVMAGIPPSAQAIAAKK